MRFPSAVRAFAATAVILGAAASLAVAAGTAGSAGHRSSVSHVGNWSTTIVMRMRGLSEDAGPRAPGWEDGWQPATRKSAVRTAKRGFMEARILANGTCG